MTMSVIVVRDAEVDGQIVDVAWSDGVVVGVQARRSFAAVSVSQVIDGDGGALIPGLHDHHLHLLALGAARQSVHVGPPDVVDPSAFGRVLSAASDSAVDGWVRAVGYHQCVAGDLDAAALDRLVPSGRNVAIRVQHRSGQLWVLNQRAVTLSRLAELDLNGVERDATGTPTGRVFGLDHELRSRIPVASPDLLALGRELASYGITSVTDLTPTTSETEVEWLAGQVDNAGFPLRVTVTGGLSLDPAAGQALERGPVKFLLPGHGVPDLDALEDGLHVAHQSGRPVAVHCVTRADLAIAMSAWRAAGAVRGDRIEHGAVIPDDLIDEIADLGLTVVTQPNFVGERGDQYRVDVDFDDQPHLWRCRSLIDRGVSVAAGTDAPFGHPDPWRAIRAAIERTTPFGHPLGPHERLDPKRALALFLGSAHSPAVPRCVAAGETTDLCLLNEPLQSALDKPSSDLVRLTVSRCGVVPAGFAGLRHSR